MLKSINLNQVNKKNAFVFFASGLLGAFFFVCFFGVNILNFTYTDWLMNGGDLTQHYLGWCFFRNSAWYFPIGLMDNIVYPFKTSIIYTDSIPAFAIIFKLLSPILPVNFQYFGLFGILCYFLQGAVSGITVMKLCNNTIYAIIGSMFFVLSATLLHRIFAHTALSAHFIILICIYICITKTDRQRDLLYNVFVWGGLIALACGTHIYFIPMVFIFMVFYFLDDGIKNKKILRPILQGISLTVFIFLLLFVLGAFYSKSSLIDAGLGFYSANLLALFNPLGMSAFLRDIPLATAGQYEGYAYLGIGIILGAFLTLVIFIKNFTIALKSLQRKDLLRQTALTTALFSTFFIFALSPTLTFMDKVLFTYPIPHEIWNIWSMLRATGRFIWVPAYMVIFLVIWAIKREYKVKIAIIVLSILLVLQFSDLKNAFENKGGNFVNKTAWLSELPSNDWNKIPGQYKHFMFLNDYIKLYSIATIAIKNKMTINDFEVARKNYEEIDSYKNAEKKHIFNGSIREDTIYILNSEFQYYYVDGLKVYVIDGMAIGLKNEFAFQDENVKHLENEDKFAILNISPSAGVNSRNCEDNENGSRVMHKDGASWSQYMELPPGTYKYVWNGDNFDHANFDLSYETGENTLEIKEIERTDNQVVFLANLQKYTSNVHARCFNGGDDDVIINSVLIQKIN